MRYHEYSLKKLLTNLTENFQGISEIYLFGSRLHKTLSTRSDVDLLITIDDTINAEDIRSFALNECPALDFFLIEGGCAISCANNSKVRAKNKKQLIDGLGAKQIWKKSKGYHDIDIDWNFKVIKGMSPIMTSLVSEFPSKTNDSTKNEFHETKISEQNFWKNIQSHPLSVIIGIVIATVVATYTVLKETRIIPLERELKNYKEEIKNMKSKIDKLDIPIKQNKENNLTSL